jgi:hypothetical protein
MDMIQYIKAHGQPSNIPNGLYAVVPSDQEKGIEKGVIFVLRNRNEKINIEKQNRLHPYYLVYMSITGNVFVNHVNPKKILDILRSLCKHQISPILDLCKQMNKETNDGYKMDTYSSLLKKAVKSIINVKEQSDINLLFNEGSINILKNSLSGLDDFELITFVVVK